MAFDQQKVQDRLDELAGKHGVVGASVAVLADDAIVEASTGVLNLDTGVEATPDSLFQIGSITKVWTASLVMRLVDEGVLDLDVPVVSYLPEFRVADPDATARVTVRHLLAHSSGIDGDLFLDTGRGDDCLQRYVAACSELEQKHPVGATMSYCNSGYSVLGRLLEVLRGGSWDSVLREGLIAPLGLTHTVTLPEEVLRFRAALGHVGEPGEVHPAPVWGLMRSAGPAGLICSTARELLAFARLHLDGGVAADGTRVLSAGAVAAMQEPQIAVPDRWTLGGAWGLGWILFDWDGRKVYGHDGATLGQAAYLRIVPDRRVAIALVTNGGGSGDLYSELFRELLADVAELDMPRRPEPAADPEPVDRSPYLGSYRSVSVLLEVTAGDGAGLHLRMTPTTPIAAMLETAPQEMDLFPVEPDVYVGRLPGQQSWTPCVFFTLPDGSRYVHLGARATRKVSTD